MDKEQIKEWQRQTRELIRGHITQYGWHRTGVIGRSIYSVGFWHSYKHPEVIIAGLPDAVGATFMGTIGDAVSRGQRYEAGKKYDDLAVGYQMAFIAVDPGHRAELGAAGAFYGHPAVDEVPMLQGVWPDRNHLFPWEDGSIATGQRCFGGWEG